MKKKNRQEHSNLLTGKVLTRTRIGVIVESGDGDLHTCRIPGKGKAFGMPVPGDIVHYQPPTKTKDGWVREVEERKSLYQRYVFGRIKEIAANLDQLVIITTPLEPKVSPRLVDRMLVGASVAGMDTHIIVNKEDLARIEGFDTEPWYTPWKSAGYPVSVISAIEGNFTDKLYPVLQGKCSLLAGASGVGKSTILNHLIDGLKLDTKAISQASGRGVHTTTFTRLYPYEGGVVADTPGIREFYPVIEAEELRLHFPEFDYYAEECDYYNCLHLDEPGCVVREAVSEGVISRQRYSSYTALYLSLKEGPRRGRSGTIGGENPYDKTD